MVKILKFHLLLLVQVGSLAVIGVKAETSGKYFLFFGNSLNNALYSGEHCVGNPTIDSLNLLNELSHNFITKLIKIL